MKIHTLGLVAAALLIAPAFGGQITFYTDQVLYNQNAPNGKFLKGIETFEESSAPFQSKTPFPNPLQHGVPRPHFDNGIDAENLIIQTNITDGACPPTPNPSASPNALWVNGAGFLDSNSIKVGTDEFLDNLFSSIDLIFTTHDKTGVALNASTYPGFASGHAGFTFCVYDQFDNILGSFFIPPAPPEPNKSFFGVWSAVPIGRVNIWGHFDIPQPFAVDNIEMWVPAPGAAGMLGLAGLALFRRRR